MNRMPRRVAYLLRAFPKISETFILGEILALKRIGVDVRIVAMEEVRESRRHPEAEKLLPEVTFVPAGMARFPSRSGSRTRRAGRPADQNGYWRAGEWAGRRLALHGVEHIHAHFAGPAATMAAAASHRTGIPFSFTAHAKDIFSRHVNWSWVEELSARARHVVTVCDYNRRFLARRLPRARLVRIYNGVDLVRWRPAPRLRHSDHILAVGRLVPKKGFHVLIDAMGLLREWDVPARASIVGEGAERARLEHAIRERRLGGRVRLLGSRTEAGIRRLMQRSRVVAAPSVVETDGNQDALPTVLLEAGACGLPAVATRVAGIPEIVRHGRTGLVVPPDDPVALARALKSLLGEQAVCDRYGRAARVWIERRFDRRHALPRLARLFTTPGRRPIGRGEMTDADRARVS